MKYLKLNFTAIIIVISCFGSLSQNLKDSVFNKPIFTLPEFLNLKIIDFNVIPAAELPEDYLYLLKGKRVAIVANQSSKVGNIHLLDFLLNNNVNVKKVFAPEHGFRGDIDRGVHFQSYTDKKTGVRVIAMFGKNRKPQKKYLEDIDVVIFDIQDVGVRFYTYISSMHNVMEICAETGKEMIILDRPNPLGDYIDGPVLEKEYKSFVGMHEIPVVHGLTVGELALMINGEKWLSGGLQCDLTVIKSKNYDHTKHWSLKIKPSPNLPNDISIRLYPSLCFFEATDISIGRGTYFPFQVIGYPNPDFGNFKFTPVDIPGMQLNPVQEGKTCYGIDLRNEKIENKFTLKYIINSYKKFKNKDVFFTRSSWFNYLAGNSSLQKQIIQGLNENEIKKTWEPKLNEYKKMRKKYLLYPDFE